MEMTTVKGDIALKRYNETVWKVVLFEADTGDKTIIKSRKNMVTITNVEHGVALHTFKQALPDWGFKMQECNGNKKLLENSNRWSFVNVTHSSIGEWIC